MWVPTRVQLADGLTKIIGWSLLEKCSNIWIRPAPREEHESPEAEAAHRQSDQMDLEQKDWWQ